MTINSTTEETSKIKKQKQKQKPWLLQYSSRGRGSNCFQQMAPSGSAMCLPTVHRGEGWAASEALAFALLRAHHPSSTEAGHSAGSALRLAVQEGSGLRGAACTGQKRNGELSSGSDPDNHLGQMPRKICSGVCVRMEVHGTHFSGHMQPL